ncbi:MAG: DUF4252 domain-containing protein [Acidobacteria bacterium]|nr:DUF4252 domain-containing protein [Acidobacteriota bacterium]
MKRLIAYFLIGSVPFFAQEIKFPASLDKLAAKAVESVDVTLDSSMLKLAGKFLSGDDPDSAKVKKLIAGLKGIYVKSFEFSKEGEYSEADVEAVRSQLKAPGWSRIVGVRSKRQGDNAEVYIKSDSNGIVGLTIVAAEPKELTLVNIDGPIDLDQLTDLGGHFGVPKMDLDRSAKPKKAEPK